MKIDYLFIGAGSAVVSLAKKALRDDRSFRIVTSRDLSTSKEIQECRFSYSELESLLSANFFEKVVVSLRCDYSSDKFKVRTVFELLEKESNNFGVGLFLSSVAVYGNTQYLADESHLTFPSTPYTEDKLKIESLIQSSVVKDKFHILRISNIYGDAEISGLFQQLWTSISINQEIVITAELFVRNFVHIDDLYRFLTIQNHDFLHKGRILNFASDSHSNIGETCEKIIAKLNSSSELKYGHKNPEILVSRVSNRKIKESFGFQFKDVSEWIDGISIKYNSGDQAHDH